VAVNVLWLGMCAGRLAAQDAQPGVIRMKESDVSDERARAHFRMGTSLYESGRFKEAAEEWSEAYALSQRAALLYNVYVAHRDASDWPQAGEALRRYLATDHPDAKLRLNLEARLRAIESALASAQPTAAPGPNASPTDEPAPEPAPMPSPAQLPTPTTQPSPHHVSAVPIVLLASGAAVVVGGVVTGFITRSKVADIEKACPHDLCPHGFDLEGQRGSARTMAVATDVLLGAGIALAAVGSVLWLTDERSTESRPASSALRVSPALACGRSGCKAQIQGQF
jgi:tetratricopeptide (TPR) repeat protein